MKTNVKLLDCTLRDGGYYNDWDFSRELIQEYLSAMAAMKVDYVEIGFRSRKKNGFKGGCGYSTDSYIKSLSIPNELKDKIAVMVNGSELLEPQSSKPSGINSGKETSTHNSFQEGALSDLFIPKVRSPVSMVRIACHFYEFEQCLPAADWLNAQGYKVAFNLMQIADRTEEEIVSAARMANKYPIDVLYFADSMGSLMPNKVVEIAEIIRREWGGELGIHAHDNMGQAVANSVHAVKHGVSWIDSTVTGMGRGPGNAQTEYMAIALEDFGHDKGNYTKLLGVSSKYFKPLQDRFGWGTNPYYYLAGKYGIHPSYIQEMMADSRYGEDDIIAVIDHLKIEGGKKFSLGTLEAARHFFAGKPRGSWYPVNDLIGREVMVVGAGPSVANHRMAIESYISKYSPFVIALNTQQNINEQMINVRAACHPVRLLADCHEHLTLPQPLVTPVSMLPDDVRNELTNKKTLDFGLSITPGRFEFHEQYCILPSSLVVGYVLAIATSGKANRILLVGFDGYGADDARSKEMDVLLKQYMDTKKSLEVISLTPTRYEVPVQSIYAY